MEEHTLGFYPGFSAQERDDIRDWLLNAQQEAGRRTERDQGWQQWDAWMSAHGDTLVNTGGYRKLEVVTPRKIITALGETFEFDFEVEGDDDEDFDRLGQKSYEIADLPRMVQLITEFLGGRGNTRMGRFETAICSRNALGQTTVLVCALQLLGEFARADAVPFTPQTRRVVLSVGGGGYEFDTQAYAQHRDVVRRSLVEGVQRRIKYLEIRD